MGVLVWGEGWRDVLGRVEQGDVVEEVSVRTLSVGAVVVELNGQIDVMGWRNPNVLMLSMMVGRDESIIVMVERR